MNAISNRANNTFVLTLGRYIGQFNLSTANRRSCGKALIAERSILTYRGRDTGYDSCDVGGGIFHDLRTRPVSGDREMRIDERVVSRCRSITCGHTSGLVGSGQVGRRNNRFCQEALRREVDWSSSFRMVADLRNIDGARVTDRCLSIAVRNTVIGRTSN